MRLKDKKILSLVLVTLLTSSLAIGCNKQEKSEDNKVVVENSDTQVEKEESELEEEVSNNKKINLYIPNIDEDNLKSIEIEVDKQFDEYALLSLLKENNPTIDKNAKVNKFEIKEEDGVKIITLDVNDSIYPKNVGSSEEILMLDSLTKSFLYAFDGDKLEITVDGKVYETGHISLEEGYMFEKTTNLRLLY